MSIIKNKAYLTSLIRNNNDAKNSPYINQITNAIANGFNNYKVNEVNFKENENDAIDRFIKYIDKNADADTIKEENGKITYKTKEGKSQEIDLANATFKIQSAEALEVAEANIPQVTEIFNKLYWYFRKRCSFKARKLFGFYD